MISTSPRPKEMVQEVKRRKVVLTVNEKLDILQFIGAGTSYAVIAEKFGIAKSTVANIKKDASKLEAFKKRTIEMGFKKATAKRMRVGEYEKIDEVPYIWFRQQIFRELNIPVSGAMLQEKARVLFQRLYPDVTKKFIASMGFQWRFSKRHNLKNLAIQGEQAASDFTFSCDFQFHFFGSTPLSMV